MPDLVLNPLRVAPPAQRILVIRLGAMGDIVRTMPAVALLRDAYPGARIDWLVEERTEEVVAGRAYVDRAIVFPRAELVDRARSFRALAAGIGLARFVRSLRETAYDLVFDFHAIARSAVLARLSRAALRIGYAPPHAREGAHWLVDERVRIAPAKRSRFARNEALVRAVIGERVRPETPALIPADEARREIEHRLGGGPAPVVLHPGSSLAAAHKRWPVERFGQLARELVSRGSRPLIATGPTEAERSLGSEVCEVSGIGADRMIVTQTFDQLAALLAVSRVFVGGDTGPLHVASLVGTPVVQLLGPTDPDENEPWPSTPWRRASAALPCRPCRRGCAAAACMRAIEVADVLEAVAHFGGAGEPLRVVPSAGG